MEENNFLKWKSASTSVVLKFSANIDSHPAKESVLDQVVGEVFYAASIMSITCHAVNLFFSFENFKKLLYGVNLRVAL